MSQDKARFNPNNRLRAADVRDATARLRAKAHKAVNERQPWWKHFVFGALGARRLKRSSAGCVREDYLQSGDGQRLAVGVACVETVLIALS